MGMFFATLFGAGVACFALFVLENIQGRISRNTRWSELTVDQWVLAIGSFMAPVGLVGLCALAKA
jgi:hypothetical protein